MKRLPLFVIVSLGFFLAHPSAHAASNLYYGQTSAGGATGADCADAFAYNDSTNGFTVSGNWGSGNLIAPGTTIHLCGTFSFSPGTSTLLTAYASGTSGNPITIKFENNALLTANYWSVPVINLEGESYVTVNGGTNGTIQATANGSGLANKVDNGECVASQTGTPNFQIVENLTCSDLYVEASVSDNGGEDTYGIDLWNGTNATIENNTLHDMKWGIRNSYATGGTYAAPVLTVSGNDIYNMDHGYFMGDSSSSGTATASGFYIYANTFGSMTNWDNTADNNHHDVVHLNANSSTTRFSDFYIYNNSFSGDVGANGNAGLFTNEAGGSTANVASVYFFNNVFVNTSTSHCFADGFISWVEGGALTAVNNTWVSLDTGGSPVCTNNGTSLNGDNGISPYENGSISLTAENDIMQTMQNQFLDLDGGSSITAINFNDYYTGGGWTSLSGASTTTFSTWKTDCSCDASSTTANPDLTGSYHLSGSSSAAWQTGTNLTSSCSGQPTPGLGALCSDKNGTARPTSGAWDMGAYEDSAISQATAPTCTPTSGNAPQSLTCLNTNGGTTVMCEAISPVTPVTNGLGTGCTTGNSLGTGSSESFSVLIGATYEFVAGTSTLADSNPTSYTFSNCPAQYQAGTPGLPNYGGIRIDQCVANIGAIPNLWTNYSADHGFSGAGTSATNDFGNKICRITDGNSDPSQIGGTFTTNYSGSDVDQHIAVDGSMFTIGRDGASYSLLYIYNGIGCPQQVQTSPGVPYEIPTKITAFSQSASTPHLLHVMNITQGGPSPVTSVNSSGTYTGTIAAGSSNNLVGDYGIVSGFGAGGNIASPTLISASTNTSVTFSGVTTTPQSCPGTCTLTVVSQAQIQNYDLSSCTVTACSPTITTVYDFAQGTELNWANGFQPSWSSVWRWSLDDTTSSIAFSNNQGAAGGQNTGTLVATYKVGSGARVMNTFPASIALTAVNGSGVYSCSCAGAVNNLFVNATMTVTGFSNSDNNVTSALITASSATSLTISATTTSETNSATAAFSVAGIPGETIVGDYGPTGSIAMTNCGGTPGSCSAPDGYNIHDMYQFGNSTANYIVGEKCLSGTGCTPGSTTLDQPYAWLIDSQNVLATNSSGHFGVGYNYIMHGTNSPQGQAGLFEVQSGGSLVSSPSSINLVSTSGPDNLPNPGAILLDIHCSWNENLGNDYYPVECGNTTVAINQAESPAHFANNGCDQHGYLQSPPNCLTTNLFTGPLVNELIIYPTAPIGGPTCTSAPCSTLPLLRLGNGYISAVSNDFSAANLIESIAPTGGYVLYSADHMGTLGSTSISVTSFTGTSGTLTFQAVNAFTAGNTITFGGFAGSNTGLNGQTVTVLSAGLSGSQFEATVSGAGYSSGRGQIVDPPPYILGGLTWQGGATAGSHAYNGGDVITPLDSNAPNCTYHALAAGNSSGSTEPTWVSGGLCITSNITDNTVTWVYDGMQNMRGDVFMVKTGIANVVIPPNNFLLLGSIYANGLFDGGY